MEYDVLDQMFRSVLHHVRWARIRQVIHKLDITRERRSIFTGENRGSGKGNFGVYERQPIVVAPCSFVFSIVFCVLYH